MNNCVEGQAFGIAWKHVRIVSQKSKTHAVPFRFSICGHGSNGNVRQSRQG